MNGGPVLYLLSLIHRAPRSMQLRRLNDDWVWNGGTEAPKAQKFHWQSHSSHPSVLGFCLRLPSEHMGKFVGFSVTNLLLPA